MAEENKQPEAEAVEDVAPAEAPADAEAEGNPVP